MVAIFGLDAPGKNLRIEPKDYIYEIADIILHPDYDPLDFKRNDVAILKLSQPVNSSIAKPITEAVSLEPIASNKVDYVLSAGWGDTKSGNGLVNYDLSKINVRMEPCVGNLQNVPGLVCARDHSSSHVRQSSCHVSQHFSKLNLLQLILLRYL